MEQQQQDAVQERHPDRRDVLIKEAGYEEEIRHPQSGVRGEEAGRAGRADGWENEAAKALEILFEGAGTPYGGSGRKSLQEQARAYRKHMQEMEAGYERFTFNASNREGKK